MKKHWQIFFIISTLFWCGTSNAVLIDRGGGMIYDTDLNVTWLQDANYAMTSGHDADGLMNWNDATSWAASLSFGGYEDWRLPTYNPSNPRPPTPDVSNEIGSLWYELSGGDDWRSVDEVGPFINLPDGGDGGNYQWYWTGLESTSDPSRAWRIDLGCACWDASLKTNEFYAWAVRSGDVSNVPEPASILLLGLGLACIGWTQCRRQLR